MITVTKSDILWVGFTDSNLMKRFRFLGRYFKSEQSAQMVETAIMFPIFLCLIMLIIFMAVVSNARTSLRYAVTNAVRLAYTRGNLVLNAAGGGSPQLVASIANWAQTCSQPVPNLFYKNNNYPPAPGFNDPAAASAFYNSNHGTSLAGWIGPDVLPNQFCTSAGLLTPQQFGNQLARFYSLIYAYQAIDESIGQAHYPCQGNQNGIGAPGCAACVSVNPNTVANSPLGSQCAADTTRIAIRCVYWIDNVIVRPVQAIINLMTGTNNNDFLRITKTAWYPVC